MRNSPDPAIHRLREQQLIDHVAKLLQDDRLRVDTLNGRRSVPTLKRKVWIEDHELELKKLMMELDVPDRDLQARMPVGKAMTVTLSRTKFFFLNKTVGKLKVVCLSPSKALVKGQTPAPMSTSELRAALAAMGAPDPANGPTTLVVMSTSGFTTEAHEAADRRPDRTLILVEPNDGGGWTVTGPAETQSLVELFDPEASEGKRQRVKAAIDRCRVELISGGVSADRIAGITQLPLQVVESELKSYAKDNVGLSAKRLDGRMVLFSGSASPAVSGGLDMPFLTKLKALFSRRGELDKKIALLTERRAALSAQHDAAYEEMTAVEARETLLRDEFKAAASLSAKKRLTSQLLQLRKNLERRQQLISVLNQQINVISTNLHSLELVHQGEAAQLPSADEIAENAAAAEAVMAELQADSELAGSVGTTGMGGLNAEEEALFQEMEKELADEKQKANPAPTSGQSLKTPPPMPDQQQAARHAPRVAEKKAEPEAG